MMKLDDYLAQQPTRNDPVMEPTRLGSTDKMPEPMPKISEIAFETRELLNRVYNELSYIDMELSGDRNECCGELPGVNCFQELMAQINKMTFNILEKVVKIKEVL